MYQILDGLEIYNSSLYNCICGEEQFNGRREKISEENKLK